ncbi:uncharacterized protein GGS22DRAFT_3689 [Annulohypoxylon maeteangense]|uniref:uncharacterized protein n=1 Tax=Annulohypoxylon maeteangense TaxID=1927788 RepID=UPI0020080A57|nr:uncharacterized protein GGS22DRAFT_3689 [Annulohypoxylon maeteangense]KAI0889753.1 hypothetical protein GGS22DRAFT_3689 [Annulohypoxylon maeteangense]
MSKTLELRLRRNEDPASDGNIPGMDQEKVHPLESRVELVASTGDITLQNRTRSSLSSSQSPSPSPSNERNNGLHGYFENAQWTADGTTLLTSSSTNLISGYIVPEDLLSPNANHPLPLNPQAYIQLSEPSAVLSSAPYFHLSSPWTQQILVSSRDHPLQLFYLTPTPTPTPTTTPTHCPPSASYPLTKHRSETFLTATSLIWPAPGTHFIAGTRSLLAKYDLSRPNSEPILRVKTIPSERHLSKGNGVGMRGVVSSLSAQPADASNASLVAAGTWTRWIGLYDFAGADGSCAATWSISRAGTDEAKVGGDGVTQTLWSPCGRYLLVSERKSTGILVYDVRVTGKLLGWLAGREASGNQRMTADVFPGRERSGGFEVWSGTTEGMVRVWEGVGGREGAHEPGWGWEAAAGRSTVGSACVHQSGAVVATCSGSWEFPDDDDEDGEFSQSESSSADSDSDVSRTEALWMRRRNKESSLKIWSILNSGEDEDDEPRRPESDEVEQ